MAYPKTPFHDACDRFIASMDGSRKVFSTLTDLFSAIAWQDFSNDWAPDLAERCFRFNRAQRKFQRDFRDWAGSISEQDVALVGSLLGLEGMDKTAQGGGQDGNRTQEAKISRRKRQTKKKPAHIKSKASFRQHAARSRDIL